ncbi:MAG: DUF1643 domain-containing protein [Ruminococcaceae bacterium]|nr:DUF1643 domain-containing protein [Oscillospiraceae bacterium]
MLVEKDTIKCEAVFDDDKTHRFLWERVWNKDKPVISVIALNPSLSDNIITDTTTAHPTQNKTDTTRKAMSVCCLNLYISYFRGVFVLSAQFGAAHYFGQGGF